MIFQRLRSRKGSVSAVSVVFGLSCVAAAGVVFGGLGLSGPGVRAVGEAGKDVSAAAEPVVKRKVLQDEEWLSEKFWQKRKLRKLRYLQEQLPAEVPADEGFSRRDRGVYRTVCVRLCDGYYFPISFATTRDRLSQDERSCQSRCSSDARLYFYRVSDGSPETMADRQGRAYGDLETAFLYRTAYQPSCQCRAAPWSETALERHATYATKSWQRQAKRVAAAERRKFRRSGRSGRRVLAAQRDPYQFRPAMALGGPSERAATDWAKVPTGKVARESVRQRPRVVKQRRKAWRSKVYSADN